MKPRLHKISDRPNSGSSGTYNLIGGTLGVSSGVVGIQSGAGTGTLNIDGGTLYINHIAVDNFNVGNSAGSAGSYTLASGRTLTATTEIIGNNGTGTFTQNGGTHTVTDTLTLGANSGSSGTYNLNGGVLNVGSIVNGAGNNTFNLGSGTLNFTGAGFVIAGLLKGTGTIAGDISSSGIVAPGNSPGVLNITGNYAQLASGSLNVEIGGLIAGTEHDALHVSGTASLDGTLNVSLYDFGSGLFTPNAGDSFDILTTDVLQGKFSTLNYGTLQNPNLVWHVDYLVDAVGTTDVVRLSVQAVPEPETYAMLLAGLGLVGFAARRRKE